MTYSTTHKATGPAGKLALLALALAGVLGVGTASAAGTDSDVPSIVVKYSDQSLSSESGVKDLYVQIVRAAKQVCPNASIRDLEAQQQVDQCREQAIARAIRKVNNSQLAALYATRSKNG